MLTIVLAFLIFDEITAPILIRHCCDHSDVFFLLYVYLLLQQEINRQKDPYPSNCTDGKSMSLVVGGITQCRSVAIKLFNVIIFTYRKF